LKPPDAGPPNEAFCWASEAPLVDAPPKLTLGPLPAPNVNGVDEDGASLLPKLNDEGAE
jgi:hypothetical protein